MSMNIFDTPEYIRFQREATLSHIAKFASDAGATLYVSLSMSLRADRMIRDLTKSHLQKFGIVESTTAQEEYSTLMLRVFETIVSNNDIAAVQEQTKKILEGNKEVDETRRQINSLPDIPKQGPSFNKKPYVNKNNSYKGGKRHGQKSNKRSNHR